MKKCSVCHSIVSDENECHVCHNSLTYEPTYPATEERYSWNKYLATYIAKNIWFSVVCCITGLLKLLIERPPVSELLFGAGACAVISLIISVFQRSFCRTMTWKYSEEYVPFKLGIWKYLLGGISIILFILA